VECYTAARQAHTAHWAALRSATRGRRVPADEDLAPAEIERRFAEAKAALVKARRFAEAKAALVKAR
jgi:hypothetical protein